MDYELNVIGLENDYNYTSIKVSLYLPNSRVE